MALGKHATLKIGGTLVAAVTGLDWAGRNWAMEETTSHDSSNKITTRNLTLATDGPVTFTLNPFNPADTQHAAVRAANQDASSLSVTITEPNGDTYAGSCGVTKCKPVYNTTGNFAYQVELTPLGEMTYTAD
jgi:DUF917 family protein